MSSNFVQRYANRTAIVCGSDLPLGEAIARRLEAEGAVVVGIASRATAATVIQEIREVASKRGAFNFFCHVPAIDTSLLDDVAGSQSAADQAGLVAGRAQSVCREAAELMRGNEGAALVNVCSVLGLVGVPSTIGLAALNGAVTSFSRALAVHYAPDVRVNCVSVGWLEGDSLSGWVVKEDPGRHRKIDGQVNLLDRLGSVEEVAGCVAFLGSREASFITGHVLVADGGFVAR